MSTEFYVVSVCHTQRAHKYITFWRPDDRGYCWPLSWAGKYSAEQVREHAGYYMSRCSSIAVLSSVADSLAVMPEKGMIDNDAGPVVLNNRANWQKLLNAMPFAPKHEPKPVYRGARRSEAP